MLENIRGANGKILLAALAGATAGIITGLLMAPETGPETRQQLARQVKDLGNLAGKPFRKYWRKFNYEKKSQGKKKYLEHNY